MFSDRYSFLTYCNLLQYMIYYYGSEINFSKNSYFLTSLYPLWDKGYREILPLKTLIMVERWMDMVDRY